MRMRVIAVRMRAEVRETTAPDVSLRKDSSAEPIARRWRRLTRCSHVARAISPIVRFPRRFRAFYGLSTAARVGLLGWISVRLIESHRLARGASVYSKSKSS